jgi:hypothetical protein
VSEVEVSVVVVDRGILHLDILGKGEVVVARTVKHVEDVISEEV